MSFSVSCQFVDWITLLIFSCCVIFMVDLGFLLVVGMMEVMVGRWSEIEAEITYELVVLG